jgi:hypothetical protein
MEKYASKDRLSLKIKMGDAEVTEAGTLFCEATFIS